jgi:hypothetical protein
VLLSGDYTQIPFLTALAIISKFMGDHSDEERTSVNRKNISELKFEEYLSSRSLTDWDYEPEIPGKKQRPDYRLRYLARELFFEVKEFRQDPKQPLPHGGAYDPYTAIREKIDAAREKFRNFKEHCCSVVLLNVDAWRVQLDDFWIMMASMLGDFGMSFSVDQKTGTAAKEPEWTFLKRGKMVDYKHRRPQNTTISALIALTPFPVGQRHFEIELYRKEHELGREFNLEEFVHFAESLTAQGLDSAEMALRVVVYENPYARNPLPRDIFLGPYDERFGPEKGRILRLFAGAEIEKLERLTERRE